MSKARLFNKVIQTAHLRVAAANLRRQIKIGWEQVRRCCTHKSCPRVDRRVPRVARVGADE